MALQASGQIRPSEIQTEFGGSGQFKIGDYYRGGAYVPDIPANSGIPTSGQIKPSDFYGASAATVVTVTEGGPITGGACAMYGFANAQKWYEPETNNFFSGGAAGSRTPTTLNGAIIDGIFYCDDKSGSNNYIVVVLRGNRAKSFFTSVTPQGGTTLNTSSSTRVTATKNGTLSTYWYWSSSPSGWDGSGTRTASFVV